MKLTDKKCVSCEGGIPKLTSEEIIKLHQQLESGWEVVGNKLLRKEYNCVNFRHTMDVANKMGDLAEDEGHHPDLHISYGKLIVEIWTHAIGGLSENDFIYAAKADTLL